MFEIRVAPKRPLIQSTLTGFMTVDEVRRYACAMDAVHSKFVSPKPTYRLVIDAKGAKIQTQDVLAAFAIHISTYPIAEKIGVVYGASLTRFQILRLLDRPYLQTCDELSAAQLWALDGMQLGRGELQLVAPSLDCMGRS